MTQALTIKQKAEKLSDILQRMKPQIEKALPGAIGVDRVIRVALTSIQQTPKLLDCTPGSVYRALLEASQLGLTLDGPLGWAYLIPFKDQATMMLGYRGIIHLLHKGGEVVKVIARAVYEFDPVYEVRMGTEEQITHQPCLSGNRGKIIGAYSVAWMKNGATSFDYLTEEDIEATKAFVKAKNKGYLPGPWKSNEGEMVRKTVLRRHAKYLPVSPEAINALVQDEYRETVPGYIDAPAVDVGDDTGGILTDAESALDAKLKKEEPQEAQKEEKPKEAQKQPPKDKSDPGNTNTWVCGGCNAENEETGKEEQFCTTCGLLQGDDPETGRMNL